MKTIQDKHISMIQDKEEKHKFYIMLDGYVIGVQYNLGSN